MARTPRTRAQKRFAAAARAQFNLKKALDRIDYEEEVILPALERIEELEAQGKAVDIEVATKSLEIEA